MSASDYYAFGMTMPGRIFNPNTYRYGHNTQEKDNEIFEGAYTAEFWEYDSRTIRRWNPDPVVKPWESPYACFSGNPIYYTDINGDTPKGNGKGKKEPTHTNAMVIVAGDKDDWDTKKMEKDNKNWKVFAANTIEDGAKMMEEYKKENNVVYDNAFILTHGSVAAGGSIDYSDLNAFTGSDVQKYIDEDFTSGSGVEYGDAVAIQAIEKIASMVEKGGTLAFGACLGGMQTDKNGNKVNPSLASTLGALLLVKNNNNINLLFNQDLTIFITPRKVGRDADNYVMFDKPLGAPYKAGDYMKGLTLVQKVSANEISLKTYQATYQLNKIGRPIEGTSIKIDIEAFNKANAKPIKN